ncbi:hypothetical protein SISNIDRAFT_468043 [Sistotremastrum niveocremeum HHB9708]|uniref:Uncharacterized protein n=1 Tax=Sistotremastrum niveocremeum HHB9708 TaxID=1314777 RepID=A0A164S3I6_9AGAM|nr:hypothetical protein SISNIDRAFT_468043 [Sistotremastrum niveocremeum HHB9708]
MVGTPDGPSLFEEVESLTAEALPLPILLVELDGVVFQPAFMNYTFDIMNHIAFEGGEIGFEDMHNAIALAPLPALSAHQTLLRDRFIAFVDIQRQIGQGAWIQAENAWHCHPVVEFSVDFVREQAQVICQTGLSGRRKRTALRRLFGTHVRNINRFTINNHGEQVGSLLLIRGALYEELSEELNALLAEHTAIRRY